MKKNVNIKFYSEFDSCRIDIKNSSKASNSIELINCSDENVTSYYPNWFKDTRLRYCYH